MSSPNCLVSGLIIIGLFKWVAYLTLLSDTTNLNLHNQLSIEQRVTDMQLQEQITRIRNSKKLNILTNFYRAGIRPNYVDTLKNRDHRAMLKSNRKAINRNWSNQKANSALKTKNGK